MERLQHLPLIPSAAARQPGKPCATWSAAGPDARVIRGDGCHNLARRGPQPPSHDGPVYLRQMLTDSRHAHGPQCVRRRTVILALGSNHALPA